MTEKTSDRGFQFVTADTYLSESEDRLVSESSLVGDYEDSMSRPGSSFLWVGPDFHLDREGVKELADYLARWLATGRLHAPAGDES